MTQSRTQLRSCRWDRVRTGFDKLFSFEGLSALVHRPRVAIDYVRELLFDVRFRAVPLASQLSALRASIDGFARLSQLSHPVVVVQDVASLAGNVSREKDCEELAELFCAHGSDKALAHDYHLVYAAILKNRRLEALQILEIGIGSNNIDTMSNMGIGGRPGASLRAFRDWAPKATIVGADVDRRVLFSEDRITTFFVDQRVPDTIAALAQKFSPAIFHLVIDDGLHTPQANINTVAGLLGLVRDGGWMVVEDVDASTLPYWQTVFSLLGPSFLCSFVKAKGGCLCLIQKAAGTI